MINPNSKIAAFIISLIASLVGWVLIFIATIIKIVDLYQYGLANISLFGFAFSIIVMSVYTFVILFKYKGKTYFPVILMFLHLLTLTGSNWLFVYLAIDVVLMILLNTTIQIPRNEAFSSYNESNAYSQRKEAATNKRVDKDNVFDAEFTTKDDD